MKRLLSSACAALLCTALFGCPGNENHGGQDAGPDANDIITEPPVIKVSGTALIHPDALPLVMDGGTQLKSVEGLTLRIEEPLLVALNDPSGVFGEQTLPADGSYSIGNVDTATVSIGIAAGIRDPADAGSSLVVPSATTLFDVILQQGKPETDLVGTKAYALPREFVTQLEAAVTPARIAQLNGIADGGGGSLPDNLEKSGFILGKIVDQAGAPVAGVKIAASKYGDRFFYPSEDLSTVTDTGTSANGLFLFVWNGDKPDVFDLSVDGHPEYLKRRGGASGGAGLVMTVYPGTQAP